SVSHLAILEPVRQPFQADSNRGANVTLGGQASTFVDNDSRKLICKRRPVRLESLTYNSLICTLRNRTLAPLGQAPVPPWTWKARWPLSFRTSSNFLSLVYSVIFVPLIHVMIVGGLPTTLQRILFHWPCFQIFDQSARLIIGSPIFSPSVFGLSLLATMSLSTFLSASAKTPSIWNVRLPAPSRPSR